MKRRWIAILLPLSLLKGCAAPPAEPPAAESRPDDGSSFQAVIEGGIQLTVSEGVGYHRESRGFYWITLECDLAEGRVAIDFLRNGKKRFEVGRYRLDSAPLDDRAVPSGVTASFYGKRERHFICPVREGILEITGASPERIEGSFDVTAIAEEFGGRHLSDIAQDRKVRIRGTFRAVAAPR